MLEELEATRPAPALPAAAPLAAVLQLRQHHAPAAIEAAGLLARVEAAERQRDALLAEAARLLQPLGVPAAELRRLADRSLSRWPASSPASPALSAAGPQSPDPAPDTGPRGSATRARRDPPRAPAGAELVAILERARAAGRRAGRERSDSLRRQAPADYEPAPAGGAVLLLDVDPASALGAALRDVEAEPPQGMRVAVGAGAGCMLDLGDLSPYRERVIQEAAAEAALDELRAALAVGGCVRLYDP
jgi:hypothetical protein